jgi:hypothetical protein
MCTARSVTWLADGGCESRAVGSLPVTWSAPLKAIPSPRTSTRGTVSSRWRSRRAAAPGWAHGTRTLRDSTTWKDGAFSLYLRTYWPKAEVVRGAGTPTVVTMADRPSRVHGPMWAGHVARVPCSGPIQSKRRLSK